MYPFSISKDKHVPMGVGRGAGGHAPSVFENFSKKGCFLSFDWEKLNFTPSGPPRKTLEKSPSAPLEKILPTPMHVSLQHFDR